MKKSRLIPKSRVVIREDFAVRLASGKNVLHIGMGGFVDDDEISQSYIQSDLRKTLHGKLSRVAATLTGLDINEKVIKAMEHQIPGRYFLADVTQPDLKNIIREDYDLILFMDVIEHLDCFRAALSNFKALLKPGGQLVISTANAYCLDSILKLAFRYESCHEEHTSYFSFLTLKRLLWMNDYKIDEFAFTMHPHACASACEWLAYTAMDRVSRFFPQYAQGILVIATPNDNASQ